MKKKNLKSTGLIFFLLLALVLIPALSQAVYARFSDNEIQAFIRVQGQIVELQQEYQTRLSEATSDQERQMINQQAGQKMLGVIQGEGLDPETFNQILTEVRDNPELMQRIERKAIEGAMQ